MNKTLTCSAFFESSPGGALTFFSTFPNPSFRAAARAAFGASRAAPEETVVELASSVRRDRSTSERAPDPTDPRPRTPDSLPEAPDTYEAEYVVTMLSHFFLYPFLWEHDMTMTILQKDGPTDAGPFLLKSTILVWEEPIKEKWAVI